VTRAARSRIRFQHPAPQFVLHMGVRRARARHDQVHLARLRRRVVRDRTAHDSDTTPQVRRDVVVEATVRVALAHHSRQSLVRLPWRLLPTLVQAEYQQVAAHLRRVGAAPLSVLPLDMAGRVHAQDRRRRAASMRRGLRVLLQKQEGRTTNRRMVRRRSRRPPQRGLAASTALRAPALSLYQSASI